MSSITERRDAEYDPRIKRGFVLRNAEKRVEQVMRPDIVMARRIMHHCSLLGRHWIKDPPRLRRWISDDGGFTQQDYLHFFDEHLRRKGLRLYRESHRRLVERRLALLAEYDITLNDVKRVIGSFHPFLSQPVQRVRSSLQSLMDEIGMSKSEVRDLLLAHPCCIEARSEDIRHLKQCLQHHLTFSNEQIKSLIQAHGQLLRPKHCVRVSPMLDALLFDIGIPPAHIQALIRKWPRVLHVETDQNLWPVVRCLRQFLIPSDALVQHLIVHCPEMLVTPPARIQKTLQIFMSFFKVSKTALANNMMRCPRLICLTPKDLTQLLWILSDRMDRSHSEIASSLDVLLHGDIIHKRYTWMQRKGVRHTDHQLRALFTTTEEAFLALFQDNSDPQCNRP